MVTVVLWLTEELAAMAGVGKLVTRSLDAPG
jgi:hypothetical protein